MPKPRRASICRERPLVSPILSPCASLILMDEPDRDRGGPAHDPFSRISRKALLQFGTPGRFRLRSSSHPVTGLVGGLVRGCRGWSFLDVRFAPASGLSVRSCEVRVQLVSTRLMLVVSTTRRALWFGVHAIAFRLLCIIITDRGRSFPPSATYLGFLVPAVSLDRV
jgi:hypothetical protein